jgi:hypothetical protein
MSLSPQQVGVVTVKTPVLEQLPPQVQLFMAVAVLPTLLLWQEPALPLEVLLAVETVA